MNYHWYPQNLQLYHNKLRLGFIGRMETFDQDFRTVLVRVFGEKVRDMGIPQRAGEAPSQPINLTSISMRTHEKIWNKYFWDFKAYGYNRREFVVSPGRSQTQRSAIGG